MKKSPLKRGSKMLKRSGFKRKVGKATLGTKPRSKSTTAPRKGTGGANRTMAWYKKELDRVFSLYIRKIYPKVCYTCGKQAERLQCGHYVSRQYLATRWSESNCRPQCWGCNGYGKGQPLIFEENLKREYGNDFVEEMKASRHQIIKLDIAWYIAQIEHYKSLL